MKEIFDDFFGWLDRPHIVVFEHVQRKGIIGPTKRSLFIDTELRWSGKTDQKIFQFDVNKEKVRIIIDSESTNFQYIFQINNHEFETAKENFYIALGKASSVK